MSVKVLSSNSLKFIFDNFSTVFAGGSFFVTMGLIKMDPQSIQSIAYAAGFAILVALAVGISIFSLIRQWEDWFARNTFKNCEGDIFGSLPEHKEASLRVALDLSREVLHDRLKIARTQMLTDTGRAKLDSEYRKKMREIENRFGSLFKEYETENRKPFVAL